MGAPPRRTGGYRVEGEPIISASAARARLIAEGRLVPRPELEAGATDMTNVPWIDDPPTLRLDDAGRAAAAKHRAGPRWIVLPHDRR